MKKPGISELKILWKNISIFFVFLCKIFKLHVSSDFDQSETSNDWDEWGGALDPSVEFSALLFLFDYDDFPSAVNFTCFQMTGH